MGCHDGRNGRRAKGEPMTEFQERVFIAIKNSHYFSIESIAKIASSEKWKNRASRGALVVQTRMAAIALEYMGLVTTFHDYNDYMICCEG